MRFCRTMIVLLLAASSQVSAPEEIPRSAPATPNPAAPNPEKLALRSGQMITCHLDHGCSEESIDGRRLFVLETGNFIVKAAIGFDRKFTHADITIINTAGYAIRVLPADFRIEIAGAKLAKLAYLDPETLELPKTRPPKPSTIDTGHGLPPPSYWGSPEHLRDKEAKAAAKISGTSMLRPATLAPQATVTGRVYFQRAPGPDGLSLVLPIAGSLFEFPYTPENRNSKKRPGKNTA